MSHWPCHIHFESILRQKKKKNYGNSNIISPCKNIINLQKNTLKETKINPSKYYYNSIITNLKFQHKPKYHVSKILI
jgi:serine protease inhibitor